MSKTGGTTQPDVRIGMNIIVKGEVQGIGYRPFVAAMAEALGITGSVCNQGGVVSIRAMGTQTQLDVFTDRLRRECPAGGCILSVEQEALETAADTVGEVKNEKEAGNGFSIVESRTEDLYELPAFPPDLGICPDCLREMENSHDRRYRYGLISCVSCGPRWSILEAFPYDRERITMKRYPMCAACKAEYTKQRDRRRHAQTISCHDCGPQMVFIKVMKQGIAGELPEERVLGEIGFWMAIDVLKSGGILALKGVGGYQLCCSPFSVKALQRLRRMKGREEKPFAVMFHDMASMREYAEVSEQEEALLSSAARPIVLLVRKKVENDLPQEVCKDSRYLGAFLPSVGVQALLTQQAGPMVVTSANPSGWPMPIHFHELLSMEWYGSESPDGYYLHGREILRPLDDSVTAVYGGYMQLYRRSRGYVPLPVFTAGEDIGEKTLPCVLAAGGDLKASFALGKGDRVILSQYLGDLSSYEVQKSYCRQEREMEQLLQIRPEVVACDLHPGYHSRRIALEIAGKYGIPCQFIQHHQAHAASVMAEHGLQSAIGVVFDGTGCGSDDQLWGGEFLYLSRGDFIRLGSVSPCRVIGGDALSKQADLAAACYLYSLRGTVPKDDIAAAAWKILPHVYDKEGEGPVPSVLSTSMGRVFDAAASILDLGHRNRYEGECAILLENAAWRGWQRFSKEDGYRENQIDVKSGAFRRALAGSLLFCRNMTEPASDGRILLRYEALLQGILAMQEAGKSAEEAALAFHLALAYGTAHLTKALAQRTGEKKICLSGGTFANRMLLMTLEQLLVQSGLKVYVNEQVPGNDGGIALGQAYVAAWRYQDELEKRGRSGKEV